MSDKGDLQLKNKLISGVYYIIGMLVVFWFVEFINIIGGHWLANYGNLPRTVDGLLGIIFGPFIHGSVYHLSLNSIPFAILGGLVFFRGTKTFIALTLFVIIISGLAVWMFGRPASHIGASGLIFGYFGYLLAIGWLDHKLSSILVAILTVFLYGGMVWGVFPTHPLISWEGHLFGLLTGILFARLEYSRNRSKQN